MFNFILRAVNYVDTGLLRRTNPFSQGRKCLDRLSHQFVKQSLDLLPLIHSVSPLTLQKHLLETKAHHFFVSGAEELDVVTSPATLARRLMNEGTIINSTG
jgi:hypothetical protein